MEMPYTREMNQFQKLYLMIDRVRIKLGRVKDDPVIWGFYINTGEGKTKVIEIDAEKLEKQSVFKTKYVKKFFMPAPKVDSNELLKFLQIIGEFTNKQYVIFHMGGINDLP